MAIGTLQLQHCATCRVSGTKDGIIAVLQAPTEKEIMILALPELLSVAEWSDGPGEMAPALWLLGFCRGNAPL